MDTFQPPPPLLPDLVVSPMQPQSLGEQTATAFFHPQNNQQVNLPQSASPNHQRQITPKAMVTGDEGVTQMMMDCSMGMTNDICSSGYQTLTWTPNLPSSISSGTNMLSDYAPSTPTQLNTTLPPSPSPLNNQAPAVLPPLTPQHGSQSQTIQEPNQLPEILPGREVEEFEYIMRNELDGVVLTNSICLLFRFSIDNIRGPKVCQSLSKSSDIMNKLYYVLSNDPFIKDDLILCYATGNLTNISKYEEGRDAILSRAGTSLNPQFGCEPSPGVESLVQSLQSKDTNAVIFAITAIHNLLLDYRVEIQEIAKEQMHCGIKYIVPLLDESLIDKSLIDNFEFKVIVLDCLQILAYGNRKNRLAIRESSGPSLILRTIEKHLNHPHFTDGYHINPQSERLIETASRVLKSLSVCRDNKVDIIRNGGISTLNRCIRTSGNQIVKTSLWTLRNLSDVISNSQRGSENSVDHLVYRILQFLMDQDHGILSCALGILANLTCNNESIKRYICEHNGIDLLIQVVHNDPCDLEVLDPAMCTLCHLMNQSQNPGHAEHAKSSVLRNSPVFESVAVMSEESQRAVEKLINLAHSKTFSTLSPPSGLI